MKDLEVEVHLDGDATKREDGFFEAKINTLQKTIKSLEFDNAELAVTNDELAERCTKLASRLPSWPKGYRPQRRNFVKRDT